MNNILFAIIGVAIFTVVVYGLYVFCPKNNGNCYYNNPNYFSIFFQLFPSFLALGGFGPRN